MSLPYDANPFSDKEADRHALWECLVRRDIDAFLAADWDAVADDFHEPGFVGLDALGKANPDGWRLAFPDLASYRRAWLEQARSFAGLPIDGDARAQLFAATTLRDIEVVGDAAVLHKKFDGQVKLVGRAPLMLRWQTLYHARRIEGRWRLTGFTGYLPNPLGAGDSSAAPRSVLAKRLPPGATQHKTAGPYSPVLEVDASGLVVISGQAAIDPDGRVVGETIEDQARLTLENCFAQLRTAGVGPADVFKVNVYMKDLADWPRFNAVYERMLPPPRPVRTAVQTGLLMTLLVEVEMWAAKPRDREALP